MSSSAATGEPRVPDHDFVELVTDRLRLRRFVAGDLDAFLAYRSDPVIARHQGWGPDYGRADALRFLDWATTADPGVPGEWFQFAIERLDRPGLIGDCAARFPDDGADDVEVGFTLCADAQGVGFATEAVGALLVYLEGRGHRRALAWWHVDNRASSGVLRRLGFVLDERDGDECRSTRSLNESSTTDG